jgi:predicted transcriptional regulator
MTYEVRDRVHDAISSAAVAKHAKNILMMVCENHGKLWASSAANVEAGGSAVASVRRTSKISMLSAQNTIASFYTKLTIIHIMSEEMSKVGNS